MGLNASDEMKPESMDPDDLIGLVKHRDAWRIFAGVLAEWILDYASYDPGFDPSRSDAAFRAGLLVVDEGDADRFLEAMEPFELHPAELARFIREEGGLDRPPSFLVDFDGRSFVNGFAEVPIHEYLPPGWRGFEGEPLDFAPDEIRRVWRPDPDGPPH